MNELQGGFGGLDRKLGFGLRFNRVGDRDDLVHDVHFLIFLF
ncbi:hypothetical protein [Rhodobacter capsulatus]